MCLYFLCPLYLVASPAHKKNQVQIHQFEKKLVDQNMNISIYTPLPINALVTSLHLGSESILQGPVARKVDNFIQRIVNFSIAVERH